MAKPKTDRQWNSTFPRRKKPLQSVWKGHRQAVQGPPKKRKPLPKQSQAQKTRIAKYRPLAKAFLAEPENENCLICTRRRESGENIRVNPATEVHHKFLRGGQNLFRGFIASCYFCRTWPHDNQALAREMGLLGTDAQIRDTK